MRRLAALLLAAGMLSDFCCIWGSRVGFVVAVGGGVVAAVAVVNLFSFVCRCCCCCR